MTPTPQGAAPLPEALRLAELMEQTSCDQKLPLETRQLAFVVCLELRRLHAVSAAAPAAPAIRQWPPVSGVGRDDGHARALMVYFSAVPTDGEMRAVQDALQAQQPTAPDLQRLHDMLYAAQRQTSMDGMHGAITAARIELSNLMAAPTAPQAGAPAVDYVPMLDDDGRAMVGTSHHYTAENIRSLVSKYKAIERGDPDALALLANEDWRTQAGVLHRVIAALADEVPFAQPQAGAESYLPSDEHYDELRATLNGLHTLCENVCKQERRVGPLGSHARGYTHKITAALRHLDALRARGAVPRAVGCAVDLSVWSKSRFGVFHDDGRFEELPEAMAPNQHKHPLYHTAQWVGGTSAVQLIRAFLASVPAAPAAPMSAQGVPSYADSTPHLHVGDSAFEIWYANYNPANKGDKQRARDAYAAGMGDPLVAAAPQAAQSAAPTNPWAAALEIRMAQGWKLKGDRLPVLCTDTINGDGVGRDDLWLCTTAALAAPVAGQDAEDAAPAAVEQWDALWPAARDVISERRRQVSAEGWTAEHDDEHENGSLSDAAACYAMQAYGTTAQPRQWPWSSKWWKPSEDPRRNLEKAGALILAEMERLDRGAARAQQQEGGDKP